jgi:hypothetical protein
VLQYAGEAGRIAGTGPADLNAFDGTLADLHRLAGNPTQEDTMPELEGRSREELDQMYNEIAYPYAASGGKVAFGQYVYDMGQKIDQLAAPTATVDAEALAAALADNTLLGSLPPWAQSAVTLFGPPLAAFLAGWAAPHTPRTPPTP